MYLILFSNNVGKYSCLVDSRYNRYSKYVLGQDSIIKNISGHLQSSPTGVNVDLI